MTAMLRIICMAVAASVSGLLLVTPAIAQDESDSDRPRSRAEVLDESFEDVGEDFDVLIEQEREDILNREGSGGIGDSVLVGEGEEEEPGDVVALEDLVDLEVSVRGIPAPPIPIPGGGMPGSPDSSGMPSTGMPGMPPSGQQGGDPSAQSGDPSGQQQGQGQEGEGQEGEGQEGESTEGGEGDESGENNGDQPQGSQRGGGARDAGSAKGENRSGTGGGQDGSTKSDPDDIPDGQNDDVVARQLRELASNETDPELREKYWEEYRRYKAGQ